MITGLALPTLALMALAFALPHGLLRWMPETGRGLVLNGLLSGLVLVAVAAGYFLWAYAHAAPAMLRVFGARPGASAGYFLRLGLQSAVIWGPVLVLTVSYLPRRWKEGVW
ncbi:hypothetical protein [Mesobacterium pallidum]|uniref:hypothetical protein n=1 Tax=Mesobacterium pallidum TaxID=2872037 RepID=UPI001EE18C98|nr:hypothetical protein [Mesobacterium pallidum]